MKPPEAQAPRYQQAPTFGASPREAVVAYGFQYVPRLGAGRSQRPIAERAAITSGTGDRVRVHDLTPAATAVARAIEDVYRDIEALRALVSDVTDDEGGTSCEVAHPA